MTFIKTIMHIQIIKIAFTCDVLNMSGADFCFYCCCCFVVSFAFCTFNRAQKAVNDNEFAISFCCCAFCFVTTLQNFFFVVVMKMYWSRQKNKCLDIFERFINGFFFLFVSLRINLKTFYFFCFVKNFEEVWSHFNRKYYWSFSGQESQKYFSNFLNINYDNFDIINVIIYYVRDHKSNPVFFK